MENASKALLMAGGVLISIILIGSLLYVYNNMVQYPKQEEELLKLEQLAEFNAEYEKYYRTKMYGTDVVTVLNKAINNNSKNHENGDVEGISDIDVEITVLKDVISYHETYSPDVDGYQSVPQKTNEKVVLKGNTTYSLSKDEQKILELLQGEESKKINIKSEFEYTMVYSGFRDFKRKYFECIGIEYSKETGKVSKLIFREIETSEVD